MLMVLAGAVVSLSFQGRAVSLFAEGKISEGAGGFSGTLSPEDLFGCASCSVGDLDGNCVPDLVVGAPGRDLGEHDEGAVWILFLDHDGVVASARELNSASGLSLQGSDFFGRAVASLEDLDGDGVTDIAVGAFGDQDCGSGPGLSGCGAVWILFLTPDGGIKGTAKISSTQGGFTGHLDDMDAFGGALAPLGDLDGNGVVDLAVGAIHDDDGLYATDTGAVWILFLKADGTVKAHQKISATQGGFTGVLNDFDQFGFSLCALGDLDQDGTVELAVGATESDTYEGSVTILSLHPDGTVARHQKIGNGIGGFGGTLAIADVFGSAIGRPGDLDQDGVEDLLVGAVGTAGLRGAVWLLYLNPDGTVKKERKLTSPDNPVPLAPDDYFGIALTCIDVDRDGEVEVFVGAPHDESGLDQGAVWSFGFLDGSVRGSPGPSPRIRLPMKSNPGERWILRLDPRQDPAMGSMPVVELCQPRWRPALGRAFAPASVLWGAPYHGVPAEIPLPPEPGLAGLALEARAFYLDPRGARNGGIVGADVALVADCHRF